MRVVKKKNVVWNFSREKEKKGREKKEGDTGQRELTRIKTNVDGDILVSIDLQASE